MLSLLVAGLAFAAAPVSKVVGNVRIIPVQTAMGEGASTVSRLDGAPTGYYYDLAARAGELRPKAKRVVLLGLGGGEMLRAARRSLPKAELVGIDNDPRMIRAAVDEFRIGAFGARAELADAFVYVKKLRGVDVLLVDLFVGDTMPPAMLTAQFWKDCRAATSAGGLVVVNIYPAHMVPAVEQLWPEAGLKVLEQHEVHGSTVVFGSL
jgi:spermidine synthase